MKSFYLGVVLLFYCFLSITTYASETDGRSDSAYQLNINLTGSLQNPAFSPDGKSIVLTRFRNGYNEGPADLYIFNLENHALTKLISNDFDNINLPGSVWNKKNAIVFSSSRGAHDEIYTIQADATPPGEIQVTQRESLAAYEPSFAPDGDTIVFESHPVDVEDHGVITTFELEDNSNYQALTSVTQDARQPNWSPTEDTILYQKYLNNQWDIWTMHSDGTEQKQVTSGEGDKTDASFSTDGNKIVFSFKTDASMANIYMLYLVSGETKQITDSSGYDGAPSISPNGEKVVFESALDEPDNSGGTSIFILENNIRLQVFPGIILYILQ